MQGADTHACHGTHHQGNGAHGQGSASDEASLASNLGNLHWACAGGDAAGWGLGWSSSPLQWCPAQCAERRGDVINS